ncbi:hypothetical protein ACWPKS_10420 [Coraliomargarita sp. W4R72]
MSRTQAAFEFYRSYIYDAPFIELLKKYNMKVAGSVPPVKWELFGALLTGSKGAGGIGADLVGWEVKSAIEGGQYEYQYHLRTGLNKLVEDCRVSHLFCSYDRSYLNVTVRALHGSILASQYFDAWKPRYLKNYDENAESKSRLQRFRRAVNHSFVKKHGELILEIKDGELLYTNEVALRSFDR